ncbi:hypothetical protein LIER_08735 [Lithospermum erythrorhizon]|uniref:Bet v I/Major latex protein domain-containing protein n=1 Tax=Lithospermum erythrorhizon TaxID=34254 RepID=A0AAV3PHF7_LITER
MYGTICASVKNDVSVKEAWEIYGTLRLGLEAPLLVPNWLQSSELIQGDGSVGTILKINFNPGVAPFSTYKEQFTVVDNEKYVKETVMIEDGLLDKGFTLYRLRFELIKDGENSCITCCTVEYELKDDVNVKEKLCSTLISLWKPSKLFLGF